MSRMRRGQLWGVMGALIFLESCGGKSALDPHQGFYPVLQLVFSTLRLRRPAGPAADPRVGPGGEDYVSHPLPDAQLDCAMPGAFFRPLDFKAIRGCLTSIESGRTARYRLLRKAVPSLTLVADEKTPPCLKEVLPEVPVPREIFFQSYREGEAGPACFSSRLALEKDEFWNLKLPFNKTFLTLEFPLPGAPPATDSDILKLLTTWALAPFWEDDPGAITARLVTRSICQRCLGEKGMFGRNDPPQPQWPEAEGEGTSRPPETAPEGSN